MTNHPVVVIGAGAAGMFAAICCRTQNQNRPVVILEKTKVPLAKVKISGGGRCNVTHACFAPSELVLNYPRGQKELLGPFNRFQPKDTIAWFEEHGVQLKTERDGRMFPVTDSSQTIIDCLMQEAKRLGVILKTEANVSGFEKQGDRFCIHIDGQPDIIASKLLIASGSARSILTQLEALGHTIQPQVPSLFTLNIASFSLVELAGLSVPNAELSLQHSKHRQKGPLLITHWGFSGPAALKLSAWAARDLNSVEYKEPLYVSWCAGISTESAYNKILEIKQQEPKKLVSNICPFSLPQNLWKRFVADLDTARSYSDLSKSQAQSLAVRLTRDCYQISGKTTNKEEFVTCGGIKLSEVDFKTMQSKLIPNLYFAGEALDIDGVTGGFNFQNAWTTGWLAGTDMGTSR